MKIAIEGCCHGELHTIYETLLSAQEKEGIKIDLLICCGDFQAVRNESDLECMACPVKYRKMQTFHEYYSGDRVAPFLTLFIGGNHEAANHMWELSYGGWVAPNIYYLGNVGVVQYGGLRIAGLSGIYKYNDYRKRCSCYCYKLSGHIDIMLSHDWPEGIYNHGNKDKLLRFKPHFRDDILRGALGSPPAMELLKLLEPAYWFSAHLHVKFPALYRHHGNEGSKVTRFLSLDKCLPRRSFLQVIDVPVPSETPQPYQLTFDPQWLAIVKGTEHLMSYENSYWTPPTEDGMASIEATLETVSSLLRENWTIPQNFVQSAPLHRKPPTPDAVLSPHDNPQTVQFCDMLGIPNPFTTIGQSSDHTPSSLTNPDEIQLDDDVMSPVSLDHTHSPDKSPLDGDGAGGWCIDRTGTPAQAKRPLLSLLPPSHVMPVLSPQLLQAHMVSSHQQPSAGPDTGGRGLLPPVDHDIGGHGLLPSAAPDAGGVMISRRNCSAYAADTTREGD